jgi:LytS/YehU family sensor histidine kinase
LKKSSKACGDKRSSWSPYTSESTIKFFSLSPGKYDLVVEGKNIGTGERLEAIHLPILIQFPFYEQAWFIIFVISLLAILVGLIYNLNIKRIRSQSEMKIRNAENKLFALQSQMKPHFLFNAINSIQNIIIDNDTEKTLTFVGKFSKLIRQTLHFSDQNSISIHAEINYLREYMDIEKLRFGNEIDYTFEIDKQINIQDVFIKPMLIQPIVENTFVHAFDSKSVAPQIEITFSIVGNYLLCTVKDNGNGVNQSGNPLNYSKGLKLVIERIQLIDSKITDPVRLAPNTPKGTIVSIQIPIVR